MKFLYFLPLLDTFHNEPISLECQTTHLKPFSEHRQQSSTENPHLALKFKNNLNQASVKAAKQTLI